MAVKGGDSYQQLVNRLVEDGVLTTPLFIDAFRSVHRRDFMPADAKSFAGVDAAMPIGEGQTISQPRVVAAMIEWLHPEPKQHIMDIGAGSGWTSVLLAHVVGVEGGVYAIERIPTLCTFGKNNVKKYNFLGRGVVRWFCQNGVVGLPVIAEEIGGFHGILASAAAYRETADDILSCIPQAWRDQLRLGGRIVLPIGSSVWELDKITSGWDYREHPGFSFVPLDRREWNDTLL